MSNCIVCEVKLGLMNSHIFGSKTKDGDKICVSCGNALAAKWRKSKSIFKTENGFDVSKISQFSTQEYLEGINYQEIKRNLDHLKTINPKLIKPEYSLIFDLPEFLKPNEIIEKAETNIITNSSVSQSLLNNAYGYIVVTNFKILLFNVFGSKEFSWNEISSVTFEKAIVKSCLKIYVNLDCTSIYFMTGGEDIAQYIQEKIHKSTPSKHTNDQNDSDPIEQLKKLKELLELGLISEQDFEAKKAEFLNKL
jgi:hypothetical protein